MKTKERFRLAPMVTASNWLTMWTSLHDAAARARGMHAGAPIVTNREAVAIASAFKSLAAKTRDGWPLWYQFTAAGYGWDTSSDRFIASPGHAARLYPAGALVEFWEATKRIATNLEEERPTEPARIDLDPYAFADLHVQGDVRKALLEDGAKATPGIGAASSSSAPARVRSRAVQRSPKRDRDRTKLVWAAVALGGLLLFTRKKPRRRPSRRPTPVRRKRQPHAA
jgi:hypothetical protein